MKQFKVKVGHEVTYWEVDQYVIKARDKTHLKRILSDVLDPANEKYIINSDLNVDGDYVESEDYHLDDFNMECIEVQS